ncbi:MAG TPA: hypothetical protein DD706_24555 [Nitrospiraceae bacterium]|nr:hypothetical protein [Nitrospiraceae bacterium]
MNNLLKIANLIAAHPNKKIEGRIRVQKTVHILKHFGVSFDEDFSFFHFGPFSQELFYEINELVKRYGILEEKGGPPSGSYTYILTRIGEEALKDFPLETLEKDIVKKTVDLLIKYDTRALELLSSYFYLEDGSYKIKGNDYWEAVQTLKKDRANTENIGNAKKLKTDLEKEFALNPV